MMLYQAEVKSTLGYLAVPQMGGASMHQGRLGPTWQYLCTQNWNRVSFKVLDLGLSLEEGGHSDASSPPRPCDPER